MAQTATTTGTQDVLGAHNCYGRGCVACHAPHSGAFGNGVATADTQSGNLALWGQNLSPLYSQTLVFGNTGFGTYSVSLPATLSGFTSAQDPDFVIIACLSCHDGNLAKVGWMTGHTVETLPIVGGTAPTFLGNDGTTAGNYLNDHPVGPSALFSCGGQYNWDCTLSGTTITPGPNMTNFIKNYGFTVELATYGSGASAVPVVTCTTCHDQHSNFVWNGGSTGGQLGLTGATSNNNWATSFFIRGPYTPAVSIATGPVNNVAAQFCRNCHGGESNEAHGLPSVPTTGMVNIGATAIPPGVSNVPNP